MKFAKNHTATATIFVVIYTDFIDDIQGIMDPEIEELYNSKNYDLRLILSASEFKKVLNHNHKHEIDNISSVEMFPLDFSKMSRLPTSVDKMSVHFPL